ncbi:MAG: MFS transporter [Treponema sp.]|jgi:MFS family permease|nr:MFS transporter [Treponema sp.]
MGKGQIERGGFRKYMGLTFLIGFGFFTMGLMDPLYDTYVPIYLRRFLSSNAAVGGIMTLDNILQLFLIPVISVWSDRTRTRLGRRMPFILVELPLAALFFSLIPPGASWSLFALLGILFCFNLFKTSVRGPVVALMPDTIPGDYRSEANGVINMMGGIGLIVSTLVLARLIDSPSPLGEFFAGALPFNIASLCIIAAVLVLLFFVREKLPEGDEKAEERIPVFRSIRQIFSGGAPSAEGGGRENGGTGVKDTSVARILLSIFFWFTAYEGAKPFLGLFLVESMGVSEGNAALAQGVAGISSVIMAVPCGYFAHRMGRKRFIRLSLVFLTVILALIPVCGFLGNRAGLGPSAALGIFLVLMFLYGAVWIGVTVNSFPMLWQIASFGNMGIYTGMYYTFSQGAAILAPPITGLIIDLAGFWGIFIFGSLCMLAAWFTMGGVKAGEPQN